MGQKYLRVEGRKPGLRLVRKQDVAEGRGLEPKINVFKIYVKLWRRCKETNATQTHHKQRSGGWAPSRRRLWLWGG